MNSCSVVPPIAGCEKPSPTVCLADKSADDRVDRYDWAALYETVASIHADHPDETAVTISADENIPYRVVVRTLDLIRYERTTADGKPLESLDAVSPEALDDSVPAKCRGDVPCTTFSDPIFSAAL